MHTVICDGGKKSGIAYGSFKIFDVTGRLVAHKQLVFDDQTSNEAEYLIFYRALLYCKDKGYNELTVLTDSELMCQQILGNYECNAAHLIRIRNLVWEVMASLTSVSIKHVRRNIISHHLGH